MEKIGEITASENGTLEVTFCSQEDCGSCHACGGEKKNTKIRLPGEGQVGDFAAVELPTGTVVKASLLAYAFPLAAFMAGMLLGQLFPVEKANIASAVLGVVFLVLSALVLRFTETRRRKSVLWQPSLNRIIPRENRDAHILAQK